ncbi:N-6 DNA methylase [Candidatus Poriferisodalis sp.]|uniref:N-6 DNA methylase n=1 Tax=Candidatus Poriferisodalis sp. TaxID=3101277 RepID=UPI003C703A36
MAAILEGFGRPTRQEDPVVHFYEDFLAAYDPKLRELRGVFYTPEPVVSYIVRSVDWVLRERFGLNAGLADTAEVKVSAEDGQTRKLPKVLILDPAAGTGTFLREVVSHVRTSLADTGLAGAWEQYVQEHLLPRLFGFELLMAPYAICHLKLALEISGESDQFVMPEGERLGVYLTNSLAEAHETASGPMFANEIVREARDADAIKRDHPVMVVIGNPPYSGHSANKGPWISDLLRGRVAEDPESYFTVDGEPLDERNPKWLNDDYVKFIRFAQWRIGQTGEGVLGFVTNHSYLDNPTFRGMRQSLMETFDEIWCSTCTATPSEGNEPQTETPTRTSSTSSKASQSGSSSGTVTALKAWRKSCMPISGARGAMRNRGSTRG